MTKEQEEAIKWVNERLIYISQNCDLDDTENKRAYDSLETVLSMLKEKDVEMEKKNKIIDEAPFVYKPMQEIIDNIQETVEIQKIIKPIYNFKAKN